MYASRGDDFSLRKGKWTSEEENYANLIITLFNQGRLNIETGTTLRSYLSDKLRCDPMRITKKYAGASSIGKQVFQPNKDFVNDEEAIHAIETELHRLEVLFLKRIGSKLVLTDPSAGDTPTSGRPHNTRSSRYKEKTVDLHNNVVEDDDVDEDSADSQVMPTNRITKPPNLGIERKRPSGLSRSGRRYFSAPDLLAIQDESSESSPPHNKRKSSQHSQNDGSFLDSSDEYQHHHKKSKRAKIKKSHSMMALMDFERLISDDNAADHLFLEFVNNMQSKHTPKIELTVRSNEFHDTTLSGGYEPLEIKPDDEMVVTLDTNEELIAPLIQIPKMSKESLESQTSQTNSDNKELPQFIPFQNSPPKIYQPPNIMMVDYQMKSEESDSEGVGMQLSPHSPHIPYGVTNPSNVTTTASTSSSSHHNAAQYSHTNINTYTTYTHSGGLGSGLGGSGSGDGMIEENFF